MKRLLKNIILFGLLGLLLLIVYAGAVLSVYLKKVDAIVFRPEVTTMIIGDSHTQAAINDKLVPGAVNVSMTAEHYLYTLSKLKALLRNNPQINTIVMGFSVHNVSAAYDSYLFSRELADNMYPKYFLVLDVEDKRLLLRRNLFGLIRTSIYMINEALIPSVWGSEPTQFPFVGYYYNSNRHNANEKNIDQSIQFFYYKEVNNLQDVSQLQIEYLQDIVNLCKQGKIKLLLVNTPISKRYYIRIPSKFLNTFKCVVDDIKKDAQYMDYSNIEIPDSCFGDGHHLNASGASIFTNKLFVDIERCNH